MSDKLRHILSLSGGKDSTALAIYMRDRVPEIGPGGSRRICMCGIRSVRRKVSTGLMGSVHSNPVAWLITAPPCFALASLVEAVAADGDVFLGGSCDHLKFAVTVECHIQPFSTSVAQPRVTQAVQAMYFSHHLC